MQLAGYRRCCGNRAREARKVSRGGNIRLWCLDSSVFHTACLQEFTTLDLVTFSSDITSPTALLPRNELHFFFFWSTFFFRAAPAAYGGSQARGPIWATPVGLQHSHSNAGSEPHLWTYTTAHSNAGSLTHWARPGIQPATSWFPVRFVNRWATMGIPGLHFVNLSFWFLSSAIVLFYLLIPLLNPSN